MGYPTHHKGIESYSPAPNREFFMFRWYLFMVSASKPYVFGSETVCFWFGNRIFLVRKPYGFGTENVKGRLPETDSESFNLILIYIAK